MDKLLTSRRGFLKSSRSALGGSWLALNAPIILAACQSAQTNLETTSPYSNFSAEEAIELEAIVDQIIPADETPGATETGVVYFIDAALGGFMAGTSGLLHQGLKDLLTQTKAATIESRLFSELSFDQQTAILKEIENTPFFGTLQFLTMMGMFCLPKYAGNRDEIGWDLLGFDHQHVWMPPFGYYDASAHQQIADKGSDHGSGS